LEVSLDGFGSCSAALCNLRFLLGFIRYTKVYWILAASLSFSYVAPQLISIVDDDESVREGVGRLLSSVGFAVKPFASAEEYLNSDEPGKTDCLLLDVRMPGKSGIELERQLVANHSEIPVIFITAHEEKNVLQFASAGTRLTGDSRGKVASNNLESYTAISLP
jgi:CheY-like chemotaxis protein